MVVPLGSIQVAYNPPTEYPDNEQDKPIDGLTPGSTGNLGVPELVFGAANFSFQYNQTEHMTSDVPIRSVRLCMRYGIRAFDTSPYYGPSEIVLGSVLKALKDEFPRESYKLITKCGRYGFALEDFDYSPSTIRRSVQRSLERLDTTYLDVVYLHDVEMVAEEVVPKRDGDHSTALGEDREAYGLALGQEGKILGEGDRKVLEAYGELKRLKEEGLVKNIGMTAYPLPTLLRVALLIQQTHGPVDVVMSYSHLTIQNDTLIPFAKELTERAGVGQLITASPLCMGLLTPNPPEWSPASQELKSASSEAVDVCSAWTGGLPNIALGFAYQNARHLRTPTVVGMGSLEQVHETMRVWREIVSGERTQERKEYEDRVIRVFDASGDINAMLHQVFVNNKTKQENLNIGVAPPSGSGLQKPYPASTHISMSRLYIAVTGANSGVGFGACERLLEQLSSEHQTDANPQFDIPVESKDVPDERPQWSGLTLIMVCRNVQKAEVARGKLLSYLDRILEARRAKGAAEEYGQNFSQNLVIEIDKCDFTSVKSVVDCARGMRTKYPYLNHLVLNAGTASFVAMDWFKLLIPLILHPIVSLTVASYIVQGVGERSDDGFGYIWQCNVFGPYLFYRELQPLLEAFHSRPDVDYHYPSRVLWTTSLEATHFYRPEDWQLVETDHSYEASKYQTELVASQLENQTLRLEEQTNRPAQVRHLLIHPGCASTGIVDGMLNPFLAYLMGLAFYLVRILGSPHHSLHPHTAGISVTHTILTPLENLPNPQRHSKCLKFSEIDNEGTTSLQEKFTGVKWVRVIDPKDPAPPIKFGAETDMFGNPRVGVMRVKQWKEYEPESKALVEKFEGLYKSLVLDHPEKFTSVPKGNVDRTVDGPVVLKRRAWDH